MAKIALTTEAIKLQELYRQHGDATPLALYILHTRSGGFSFTDKVVDGLWCKLNAARAMHYG